MTRKANDPEQSQAFLEAARKLGCEENLGRLDEMIWRVAKLPPQPRPAGKRAKKKDRKPD